MPVRRIRLGAALLGFCLLAEPMAAAATAGTQAGKKTPSKKSGTASSKTPATTKAAADEPAPAPALEVPA